MLPPERKRPFQETDLNSTKRKEPAGNETKRAKHSSPQSSPPPSKPTSPTPPDYKAFSLPELKDQCKKRQMPVSGRSWELRDRLRKADHDSSLPVKKSMEAAARTRRANTGIDMANLPDDYKSNLWSKLESEVLRRGPNGEPVYDNLCYQLDYAKLADQPKSSRYRPSLKKLEAWMDRLERERKTKAEIMGVTNSFRGDITNIWDDRVAQDLEIPYHKVEICDFEEWKRRGFSFDPDSVTAEDRDRIFKISTGCAFRC